jgi:hypothetical protein
MNHFKTNLKTGLHFLKKWIYLSSVLLIPLFYVLILNYYTPRPFHLQIKLNCDQQPCQFQLDDSVMQQVNTDLQNQIDDANRLDEFAKPFGGFVRVNPRVTNQSTFTISVSNPAQEVPQKALYDCQLLPPRIESFSYGAGIFFSNKSSLAGVPDLVKSVSNTLLGCFRGLESQQSGKGIVVAPNGIVSLKDPKVDFLVEFFPDELSKFLVALEALALFLALLPLSREGFRFLKMGWSYFID